MKLFEQHKINHALPSRLMFLFYCNFEIWLFEQSTCTSGYSGVGIPALLESKGQLQSLIF